MAYVLIVAYVVLSAVGAYLLIIRRNLVPGTILVAAGLVVISIHYIRERLDHQREMRSQHLWVAEIQAIADDLSLSGYGIATLEELADYHDALGRQAVLNALRSLPPGQRRLLQAAQQIEPDAVWD